MLTKLEWFPSVNGREYNGRTQWSSIQQELQYFFYLERLAAVLWNSEEELLPKCLLLAAEGDGCQAPSCGSEEIKERGPRTTGSLFVIE